MLHEVATASEDIGPLTLSPDGDVVYTSSTRLFLLPAGGGAPRVLATGLNSAHGVAVAPDGTVLVSDTSNNRVLRVDPRTGATSTVVETGEPRGLAVAADGTFALVEAGSKRVGRFDPAGRRLARVGPSFSDPYDVAIDDDGTTYVVDTAAAGRIVRVTADGRAQTIPTG
jgi:serine/threonine-protein kinase